MYRVKELFLTIQGEGMQAGRVAVFCRFAGCNLWSGREADRSKAICQFCDTDFVGTDGEGGGEYTAVELANKAIELWPSGGSPYIVCTGGEPLLQLDGILIDELHAVGFEIAVETNGTFPIPDGVDWSTVSPKIGSKLKAVEGDELKLVFPQQGGMPKEFDHLGFDHFLVQPMDGNKLQNNTKLAIEFCLENPKWKLSIQTHKMIGVK